MPRMPHQDDEPPLTVGTAAIGWPDEGARRDRQRSIARRT